MEGQQSLQEKCIEALHAQEPLERKFDIHCSHNPRKKTHQTVLSREHTLRLYKCTKNVWWPCSAQTCCMGSYRLWATGSKLIGSLSAPQTP